MCRCLTRFVPTQLSWCGPDCLLPGRRAWAQGVRDAVAELPPIEGIERESQAVRDEYEAGRKAGGAQR
jgi:hypothetical protein